MVCNPVRVKYKTSSDTWFVRGINKMTRQLILGRKDGTSCCYVVGENKSAHELTLHCLSSYSGPRDVSESHRHARKTFFFVFVFCTKISPAFWFPSSRIRYLCFVDKVALHTHSFFPPGPCSKTFISRYNCKQRTDGKNRGDKVLGTRHFETHCVGNLVQS